MNSGFNNIEKLTSVLYRPCRRFTFKHCIRVATKDKMGKRMFHHKEFDYLNSTRYTDVKYLKSINIEFYGYLLIEEQGKDWTERETLNLNYRNLPIFIRALNETVRWFEDEKFDDLYYFENGRLKLNGEFSSLKELVSLGENKSIKFRPTVIEESNEIEYEGVEMFLNKSSCVGFITIDNLYALKYIFDKFDLYQSSLELLNYLGRPEFDEFKFDLSREGEQKASDQSYTKVSMRGNNKLNSGEVETDLKKLNGFFK